MLGHILYISKEAINFLFITIPLQLIGMIVVAIALLFYLNDRRILSNILNNQRLPELLKWYDNGDPRDRKYGINGDLPHQAEYLLGSRDRVPELSLVKIDTVSKWTIYRMRYNWLAIRNPLNYYKNHVLGERTKNLLEVIDKSNEEHEIGDYPSHYAGYRYRRVLTIQGKDLREYYLIKPWFFNKNKCVRIRIGYKLGHEPMKLQVSVVQRAFAIQPWKTFKGNIA